METKKITISTIVDVSNDKAWNYYTLPEHITKWNFADPSWHCPSASNEMRPGGTYMARMEAKDGSFGFDFEAVYDTVVVNESFQYTLSDDRKVNAAFKKEGDKTEVVIQFDPENENPVDMQKNGWQAILDNFKKYAEGK